MSSVAELQLEDAFLEEGLDLASGRPPIPVRRTTQVDADRPS
jgi:hypothetical protein